MHDPYLTLYPSATPRTAEEAQPLCKPYPLAALFERLSNVVESPCTKETCVGKGIKVEGKRSKGCPHKSQGVVWSPVKNHGNRRSNDNISAITVAVFDLDRISRAQLEDIERRIAGFEFFVHSTHTHARIDPIPAPGAHAGDVHSTHTHARIIPAPGAHAGDDTHPRTHARIDPIPAPGAHAGDAGDHSSAPVLATSGKRYADQATDGLCEGPYNNLRLIMPLSREVLPAEWPSVLRTLVLMNEMPADPTCKDLSRLYYLPTRPQGVLPVVKHVAGIPINVDLVQQIAPRYTPQPTYSSNGISEMPASPRYVEEYEDDGEEVGEDDTVDVAVLRKLLVRARRRKANSLELADVPRMQILDAVLTGSPLAPKGDRSNTVNRAVALIAHYIPLDTMWEVVAELIRPSIAAMDVDPEGLEHWMEIANESYERAVPRAKQHAQEAAEAALVTQTVQDALLSMMPAPPPPPPDIDLTLGLPGVALPPSDKRKARRSINEMMADYSAAIAAAGVAAIQGTALPEDTSWKEHLIKTADNKIVPCTTNACLILTNSPTFKGTIRYNLLSRKIEMSGNPYAEYGPEGSIPFIASWLHKYFKMKLPKSEVEDAVRMTALTHDFDPVVDYLRNLKWDGIPRLKDLFIKYAQARLVNENGVSIEEHVRKVGIKFMVAAVARALRPGCQADSMLVLEGPGGVGKTSFLRRLFFPWFITMKMDMASKDAQMVPGENWCCEIGELAAIRKSDSTMILTYLSETEDNYRRPYDRDFSKVPRRNVCAGTTNDEKWLAPDQGLRRYWPVYIESVDRDAIALVSDDDKVVLGSGDRDQLWAEAVALFDAGEKWYFTGEERKYADKEAAIRINESFVEQKIAAWFIGLKSEKRSELVSMVRIVEEALGFTAADRVTRTLSNQIEHAMERIGFAKKKFTVAGRQSSLWVPPKDLVNSKVVTPTYLRSVKVDEMLNEIAESGVKTPKK